MKQLLHLTFTAFLALNLTWGHDWVHIPQLWKHYAEHRQEQPSLDLLGFLEMHYTDAAHHGTDASHDQLPFSHDHQDHIGVDHVFFAPIMKGNTLHRPTLLAGTCCSADEPLDGHRPSTLQPPRA
ncbi:MAG: hypothetical protein JNM31_13880 [Flavobacteriales bacterium]|nr:hypothetical protein [Flavobacteriales bacterium]